MVRRGTLGHTAYKEQYVYTLKFQTLLSCLDTQHTVGLLRCLLLLLSPALDVVGDALLWNLLWRVISPPVLLSLFLADYLLLARNEIFC